MTDARDLDSAEALAGRREAVRKWWEASAVRDPERESEADKVVRSSCRKPDQMVGLALSGGGIRSATFSLGLLQSLAGRGDESANALGRIDILSTVSGGGYIGCFLRSLFVPRELRGIAPRTDGPAPTVGDPSRQSSPVQRQYEFANSALTSRADQKTLDWDDGETVRAVRNPIWWLREHSRYLAPNGASDYGYAFAYLTRNWLAMIYVFALAAGLVLSLPILVAGALTRFWPHVFDWSWIPLAPAAPPCAHCAAAAHFVPVSPVAALAAVPLLISIMLGIAYWMTEAMSPNEQALTKLWKNLAMAVLAMLVGVAAIVLFAGWITPVAGPNGWPHAPTPTWPLRDAHHGAWHFGIFWPFAIGFAAALVGCVVALVAAGLLSLPRKGDAPLLTAELRRRLTEALATSNGFVVAILAIALLDSLGAALDSWVVTTRPGLSTIGTALVPLLALLIKKLPDWFSGGLGKGKFSAMLVPLLQPLALVAGLVLYGAVAVGVGAMLHHLAWTGPDWTSRIHGHAFGLMLFTLAILALIAGGSTGFINLSSLHGLYAARLTRAYLGATNLRRLAHVEAVHHGSGITENDPEDYIRPETYNRTDLPAPLHLINTTLNETIDPRSQLVERDRKGEILTLGPAGIEIGATPAVGWDVLGKKECAEQLSLGQWCAISGAAASSGMGRLTNLGYALALSFANVRLGYWWWSPGVRSDLRKPGWLTAPVETFLYLFDEMTARYSQSWRRKYLTDGGHFENSGAYPLLRRRVPLILVSDNGADPDYLFPDLENLIRTSRIDLGCEIAILQDKALKAKLGAWGCADEDRALFIDPRATPDWRAAVRDPASKAAFLVLEAAFEGATVDIVWIKPCLCRDLPADVLGYATKHQPFPQQTTAEQFFDEAQWESYRKLGETTMARLLTALPALL